MPESVPGVEQCLRMSEEVWDGGALVGAGGSAMAELEAGVAAP